MNALAILPINAIRNKAASISEKHLQPISDDLDTYIKNKMLTWKTQSSACIKPYADDLNAEINSLCDEFDAHVSASFAAFEMKGLSVQEKLKVVWDSLILYAKHEKGAGLLAPVLPEEYPMLHTLFGEGGFHSFGAYCFDGSAQKSEY